MGDIISPEFPVNTENVQETISIDKGLINIDTNSALSFGMSVKVTDDILISIVGREGYYYIAELSTDDETIATKKCKSLFEAFIFVMQAYNNRGPK